MTDLKKGNGDGNKGIPGQKMGVLFMKTKSLLQVDIKQFKDFTAVKYTYLPYSTKLLIPKEIKKSSSMNEPLRRHIYLPTLGIYLI